MIKNDKWIIDKCKNSSMIDPYSDVQVKEVDSKPVISYGVSSYGYDMKIADEFKLFSNINNVTVDPKKFDQGSFVDIGGEGGCMIPPNSFVLGRSVEYFKIPDNVIVVCLGKSTYARCGLIVNVTPLEPGWQGHVTIEISNSTPLYARVYANEGIAQLLFFEGDTCKTTYADRKGKYQSQLGIVLPKV